MTARPIHHEPLKRLHWGCTGCSAIGDFPWPPEETCDETAVRILEAHAIASPECTHHPFTRQRVFEPHLADE